MGDPSAVMTHPMVGVKRDDDLPVGYGPMEETIAKAKATNKLMAQHGKAQRRNESERNERRNKITKRRRHKKRRR